MWSQYKRNPLLLILIINRSSLWSTVLNSSQMYNLPVSLSTFEDVDNDDSGLQNQEDSSENGPNLPRLQAQLPRL